MKNVGTSYTHSGSIGEKIDNYNKEGLTPNLSPGAKNDTSSTTKSAISRGTITTTKEQIDINAINRDTQNSLNELGQIFDKKKLEERQELAQLFAKNADELLHYYDREGKFDKALAHGIVAEISSQLAGNKAGSGFAAGFTNEALINKIKEWAGYDPAKMQWISAALGVTVSFTNNGNITMGAMISQYVTKWNHLGENKNAKPIQAGIEVETNGLGHVSLIIKDDDNNYEQGNFGRYVNVTYKLPGIANTTGSGTYVIDNYYYPYGNGTSIYLLNPAYINANDTEYSYNYVIDHKVINGVKYQRFNEPISLSGNRTLLYYYKMPVDTDDYILTQNNCVTTTIYAIAYGAQVNIRDMNIEAKGTLGRLQVAISPYDVKNILEEDYEWYGGKGLVVEKIQ